MSIHLTKWRMFVAIALAVLLLDQVSKAWIVSALELYETVPLIEPVLSITRTENMGIFLGLGSGLGSPVFFVLSLAITLVIVYLYRDLPEDATFQKIGLSLAMGGGVGNMLDRLQHGVVIDFVHITIPNVLSNVSNFADHALTLGVIIMFVDGVRWELQNSKPRVEESV